MAAEGDASRVVLVIAGAVTATLRASFVFTPRRLLPAATEAAPAPEEDGLGQERGTFAMVTREECRASAV